MGSFQRFNSLSIEQPVLGPDERRSAENLVRESLPIGPAWGVFAKEIVDQIRSLSIQEIFWLRHHDKQRWSEYLYYRWVMHHAYKRRLELDFPLYLLIEPTSICNLRCPMCFQSDASFRRKPYWGHMTLSLFKSIVDQAANGGTKAVTLASRGEPTLVPDFAEMLAYTRGKFLDVKVNTNATRLTDELMIALLDAEVSEVVLSIDAGDPLTYETLRLGANFDDVLGRVRRFHEIRSSRAGDATYVRVSGVRVSESQDFAKLATVWGPFVDDVGWTPAVMRWDTYANPTAIAAKEPCHYLWERMYVWFDGTTNPCDVDYKSHLSPGNVVNEPIKDIWLRMLRLRELHEAPGRGGLEPCIRCEVGSQ